MNERPAARVPRRQRRSAQTRARLLDAATTAFLARGYDALTLAEVTDRADLGTGTLYLHFRDKRALYEAVVRRALGTIYERWQRTADATAAPTERVLHAVRVMIELATEQPELVRLCLLDGPPVESWLVDEVAHALATLLDGRQRELRASLIIGTAVAACRHYLRNGGKPGARTLLETTLAFCTDGADSPRPRRNQHGRSA